MNDNNKYNVSADTLPVGVERTIYHKQVFSWKRPKYYSDPFRYFHLRPEAVSDAINLILVLKEHKGATGYLSREDLSSDHVAITM